MASKCARIAAVVLLLLVAVSVSAQSIGTIAGQVKDPSGAAVPGATVTITDTDTNLQRTVMTGADGTYTAPALPVGPYSVKVERTGFLVKIETGLKLEVAQQMVVNVALEVGSTTQEVMVTGEAQLVNTTSGTLSNLVDSNQIESLPLNGRSYLNLTLMEPGVNQQKFIVVGIFGTGGTTYAAGGATLRSNNYLLDGTSLVNMLGVNPASANGTTLGLDGIKEYRLITNNFSAEYGNSMGSQTVMVSKSGTNQLHGTAFEYLRNSSLDAASYFSTPLSTGGGRIAPFKENNFGGSLGGPIKKDKTFVFGTYEGFRQRLGVATIDNVLPAACHGGLGATITDDPNNANDCNNLGATAKTGTLTVKVGGPTGAGAAVVPFLALVPNPNLPNNQYTYPYTQPTREDYGQVRADQNFSSKDSAFVRYTIDDSIYSKTDGLPLFHDTDTSRNQYITIGETHIFTQKLLATARLSYSRTVSTISRVDDPSLNQPQYEFLPPRVFGFFAPGAGLTSYNNNLSTPQFFSQNLFSGGYDVVYDRGRHQIKFGTLFNYYQIRLSEDQATGQANFLTATTFLQGISSQLQGIVPGSKQDSTVLFDNPALYVQDDVKVTRRFTLNLGLRYEFNTALNRKGGGYALRNWLTDSAANLAPGPIALDHSLHNFSPRLGFAWDVFGNGKTSVRGGVDYLYDYTNWVFNSQMVLLARQPPLVRSFNVLNPGVLTVPFSPAVLGGSVTVISAANYNTSDPRILTWNLTVERQLPGLMSLAVGYVGSRGFKLQVQGNESDLAAPMSSLGQTPGPNAFGQSYVTNGIGCDGQPSPRPNGTECWGPKSGTCEQVIPSCRLNPNFTNMGLSGVWPTTSWYNALRVVLTKQVSKGLQFQSSYVWSSLLDDGSTGASDGAGAFSNLQYALTDWGHPIYDITHNWRFNSIYHLPNLNSDHRAAAFLKGWWISGIASFQTGYAVTPVLGGLNRSLNGSATGPDRPDYVTSANLATALTFDPLAQVFNNSTMTQGGITQYFNPHMFTLGPVGYLGQSHRGSLRGPSATNIDFSIGKDTHLGFLGEAGALGFRAEFFNLPNHPNFGLPASQVFVGTLTDVGEAPVKNAGQITTTVDTSRQIQLSLRLSF